MNFDNCPKCGCKKLYKLKNNYLKCKECNKKFSPQKYQLDFKIIDFFCNDYNVLETSQILNLNYRTVQNRYVLIRKLCASYLDDLYQNSVQEKSSYEEHYFFTQKDKKKKRKSIYDAINIIGFYSNNRVFTLLMSPLPKPINEQEDKSFEKYLQWHKIYSQENQTSVLKNFWIFLDESMKKYNGINPNNFFHYLKECEFKFNFSTHEQKSILENFFLV